jgi:energy-coupling factor transport system ATP-binding protein
VAIAGIVALQPLIIVLDEATSMLDPEGRKDVVKIMKTLNKTRGLTVLSITHDLEETTLADRIIVLNQGKLIRSGTPRDIYREPETLEQIGLDLPFAIKLRKELEQKGLSLSGSALSRKELVNELWTLHSHM